MAYATGREHGALLQKLAGVGRLLAGVAHEVKTVERHDIHLELLRAKLVALEQAMARQPRQVSAVAHHASVIEREIRRLDDVVQASGFSRPTSSTCDRARGRSAHRCAA